jgi:hypothetical protein
MAYNFLPCDRDQGFLLPLEVRDWLPADHLAWFVLDVVDQLDLGPFLMAVERSQRREPGPPEMIWMPWAGKTSSKACLRPTVAATSPAARLVTGRGLCQHSRGLRR